VIDGEKDGLAWVLIEATNYFSSTHDGSGAAEMYKEALENEPG
jgi:hypothetical protein